LRLQEFPVKSIHISSPANVSCNWVSLEGISSMWRSMLALYQDSLTDELIETIMIIQFNHSMRGQIRSDSPRQTWVVFWHLCSIPQSVVASHNRNESWTQGNFLSRIIICDLSGHSFKSRDCYLDSFR
jgi:hypothetical protein